MESRPKVRHDPAMRPPAPSALACALFLIANRVVSETSTPDPARWLGVSPPPPPLTAPSTPQIWMSERQRIRIELEKLLGDLPPRPAVPRVQVISRENHGTYEVERFHFDNGLGETVPGVFILPTHRSGRLPALLYCHWHGGEYQGGKSEVFENRHTPEVPAAALAARGYAVLAIDAPCFGERNGRGPDGTRDAAGEQSASKYHLWYGRSLWGALLRDDRMALDYLLSRPEIDPARIGVTGISMGATRSWWLMALDERIKAGVAVACLTRYQDLIAEGGLRHHGIYYFVPGMLRQFDTESVIALAAPRPLLCLTGGKDGGSPVSGIRRIEEAVRPIWRLTGRDGGFESVIYPELGHVYTPEMWLRMLAWFDSELHPQP
jgi:dienelactone hydrolase